MKIVGVIPARYKSSRFPGKPLVNLLGTPMIIHVARIVEKALGKANTYIATDDIRIKKVVEDFGFKVVMTSESCLTGTDRLWEFAKQIEADIYINVQGDEPLVNPKDIKVILEEKKKNFDSVINGMCDLSPTEDFRSVNIPKVVVNSNDKLIYMSRLPIPGIKDNKLNSPQFKKQVCIYAFNYNELKAFGNYKGKASFEEYEDIEILRFFDLGIDVKMIQTENSSLAVDIPQDVSKVEQELKKFL